MHQKLTGIDLARGIAAILVVLFHASRVVYGHSGAYNLFEFGHAGVEFFFVLSGFIIYYVHGRDFDRPRTLYDYAVKRFVRIFPLYWLMLVVYVAKEYAQGTPENFSLVRDVFFVSTANLPLIKQAWTLAHEVLFYVLFGLLLVASPVGKWCFVGWIALVLFSVQDHTRLPLLAHYNVLFLFGMLVGYLDLNRRIRWPAALAAVGAVGFVAAGLLENSHLLFAEGLAQSCVYGAFSAALIAGLLGLERQRRIGFGRLGAGLGAVSYPLYLCHGIVVAAVYRGAEVFGVLQHDVLVILATLAVSLLLAVPLTYWVDRPLRAALMGLVSRRLAPARVSP